MIMQTGKPEMSNLLVRALTSVPLVILTLAAVWSGGYWFMAFCTLIGALVLYEWGMITATRQNGLTRIASFVCYAATAVALFVCAPSGYIWFGVLAGVIVLAVLSGRNAGWVAGGYLYAAVFMITLSLIRRDEGGWLEIGFISTVVLFVSVWATDIGAYFCGRLIGGPKLAPRISPNKTWSGAIGGVLIAVFCMVGWVLWKGGKVAIEPEFIVPAVIVPLLLSVASQFGDLGESWLKRHFNVKDSGNILPGHGGIMDRVDGLLAASAVLYVIIRVLL